MEPEEKKIKTTEESLESLNKTLYRMNGTLMAEGELGANVASIARSLEKLTAEKGLLEKMNWNLGSIAKALNQK